MTTLFSYLPTVEQMHRNYAASEALVSKRENRAERRRSFMGVSLVSELGASILYPLGERKQSVELPERPTLIQKVIAFVLVQVRAADFARRENQYIGYAFSGQDALRIFSW